MKLDDKIPGEAQQTANLPLVEQQEFNWRHCWYPVTFVADMPKNSPLSFSLYDEPLVLFRDENGKIGCLVDRCSHRAARLSYGRIAEGKIECLYHGWQFNTQGKCTYIPQLAADTQIPSTACVKSYLAVEHHGMVWIWPGEPELADISTIPTLSAWEKPGIEFTDFVIDLPYDQTYLIENLLDPAHVPVSHHGSQGDRQDAQPLEMEILESSDSIMRFRWRRTRKADEKWRSIDYYVPNLVAHTAQIKDDKFIGLAFYSIPLGRNRCRLLARTYTNFMAWLIKLRPVWMRHLSQLNILEQDTPMLADAQQDIEQTGKNLKELYLPFKTCDLFVLEYRKWLDKVGDSLPFYEGYSTAKHESNQPGEIHSFWQSRYWNHTRHCSECDRAYQLTKKLPPILLVLAIVLVVIGMLLPASIPKFLAISAFVVTATIIALVQQLKAKFELSYNPRSS